MVAINTAGSMRRPTSNAGRTAFGIVDLRAVPTTLCVLSSSRWP